MLLTIDIGNSNIVCVVYSDSKEKLYDARYETIKEDVKSAYKDFVLNQIYFYSHYEINKKNQRK